MPPVTIAVGYKADGTVTHLYTGFNALEALDKIDQAGSTKSIVRGEVYHAPTPIRSRDFTSGTGRDGGAQNDEAVRMQRINALKELTHEEIAALAQKYGVKVNGQPADENAIKKSMANRMYVIVAIYDAEVAEGVTRIEAEAEALAVKVRTDAVYVQAAQERAKALEQMSNVDLLEAAAKAGLPNLTGLVAADLDEDQRDNLVLELLEKELPAPNKSTSGTVTGPKSEPATGLPPRGLGAR